MHVHAYMRKKTCLNPIFVLRNLAVSGILISMRDAPKIPDINVTADLPRVTLPGVSLIALGRSASLRGDAIMTLASARTRRENYRRQAHGEDPLPTLRQLRKLAKEHQVTIYRQGGQWIQSAWSDGYNALVETPLHWTLDNAPERVALAAVLGV